MSKNQEVTIQQLRRKKTRKYRQLRYGEQIPEKQTRNSSVKSSQPNQEQKSSNNNQYNTKRTYAAALKSNQPTEELIHEMQQVTMATENLKKRFDQMLKLS